MKKSKWIWYPGSFELYHGMLLHNRRTSTRTYENGETRSVYYYPMWRVDAPRHNARLTKTATIDKEETIEFFSNTDTSCLVIDDMKYNSGSKITLPAGTHTVTMCGFKAEGFPAFYCIGDTFATDRSWVVAENDDNSGRHAGESELYTSLEDNPEIFKFSYKRQRPISCEKINGGMLFDLGKETFGKITISGLDTDEVLFVSLGESREEALDVKYANIGLNVKPKNGKYTSHAVAFRYVFVPVVCENCRVSVAFEYLPLKNKGAFKCDDALVNKLWDVCAYTMLLNSREGFFDGIKRDRWVWSGDAYQSYFVNYYLANNNDIVKRTMRMLRGADPITKHVNTICDYTFLWLSSIWEYYLYSADADFVVDIYPEMLDMWRFVEARLSDDGMYERKSDDWVFIDWSTFDSNGPICAEQMLLARAYECLAKCAEVVGDTEKAKYATSRYEYIKEQINKLYWSDKKGAFVDDYKSGRENVTRHANIFALLFDYTTEDRKNSIIKNVIYNDKVTKITTPYFEFYELDAMCKIGDFDYVSGMLHSYWGKMLELGATTIWEEFDPTKNGIEHYEMYGGKYEKSLCHAWGASPIYLLGRYALGVYPTDAGYKSYEVKPSLMSFKKIEGKVPTPNGDIFVKISNGRVTIKSSIDGGALIIKDRKYKIEKDIPLTIKY
ncbi:MAG: alpha-rhamnosidase [Clostridia bacterium]|nr:alpha-rhamnosidase [Clostridia bacterium]